MTPHHLVFLDGVTGFLGRWTLFWFLEELKDERVAVLIRPKAKGEKAQAEAQARLDQILSSIGMTSERERVTVIPGDLKQPEFGNPEALADLQAASWLHMAGDVTFRKLGDKSSLVNNLDFTVNFIEAAANAPHRPQTVCHTSTFYVFEKAGTPEDAFQVPEAFHDPSAMEHHNAYGYSKLKAEIYLQSLVDSGSLPFNLLIYRPDIVMHHIPVPEVAQRNPGLITDDFKVTYQLMAAILGRVNLQIPNGPALNRPIPYLPVDPRSQGYISDVDGITKAIMQLTTLHADGGLAPEQGYSIFQLVNRWQPLSNGFMRQVCERIDPETVQRVTEVMPETFRTEVLPSLSWWEKLYYTNLIDPFVGYMNRPRTIADTSHVDAVLGEDWHNLHPAHGLDIAQWLESGCRQALEKDFGRNLTGRVPAAG